MKCTRDSSSGVHPPALPTLRVVADEMLMQICRAAVAVPLLAVAGLRYRVRIRVGQDLAVQRFQREQLHGVIAQLPDSVVKLDGEVMLVCLVGDAGQRVHGVVVERVCAQGKSARPHASQNRNQAIEMWLTVDERVHHAAIHELGDALV